LSRLAKPAPSSWGLESTKKFCHWIIAVIRDSKSYGHAPADRFVPAAAPEDDAHQGSQEAALPLHVKASDLWVSTTHFPPMAGKMAA
jgi:hypothetical protein